VWKVENEVLLKKLVIFYEWAAYLIAFVDSVIVDSGGVTARLISHIGFTRWFF